MNQTPETLKDLQHGGDHYKKMAIQPVQYCHMNQLRFCESSAIKYLSRFREKQGAEDVKKAIHFCQMILEMEFGVITKVDYTNANSGGFCGAAELPPGCGYGGGAGGCVVDDHAAKDMSTMFCQECGKGIIGDVNSTQQICDNCASWHKSNPCPHWEAVPAIENGKIIGYQVKWSEPNTDKEYLWVGHYYAGSELSLGWCENAAERMAKDFNEKGAMPQDFESYRKKKNEPNA